MEPEPEPLYTVFFKDREANYVNKLNPNRLILLYALSSDILSAILLPEVSGIAVLPRLQSRILRIT